MSDDGLRIQRMNSRECQAPPEITGLEPLTEIRRRGYNVPVIFVSGMEDVGLRLKIRKAGACDYAVKTCRYYANLKAKIMENIEPGAPRLVRYKTGQ